MLRASRRTNATRSSSFCALGLVVPTTIDFDLLLGRESCIGHHLSGSSGAWSFFMVLLLREETVVLARYGVSYGTNKSNEAREREYNPGKRFSIPGHRVEGGVFQ